MRPGIRLSVLTFAAAAALSAAVLSTAGCGAFFVCQKASCPSTGTTTTGNGGYVYVSNSMSGSTYVNAYTVGTNSLTAVTNSPFKLNVTPVAMAVSPTNDQFLYVAGQSSGGLYLYSISTSTGELSGGSELEGTEIDAMTISPDGNYLYTVGEGGALGATVLTQYSVNTSTGALGAGYPLPLPTGASCLATGTPPIPVCGVAVAPTKDFVAVATGYYGTVIYPYTSSAGITQPSYTGVITPGMDVGDYSVAFDDSDYVYVTATGGVYSYDQLSNAAPNYVNDFTNFGSGSSSGLPIRSVTLSTNYGYLFTADTGTNQIAAFSLSGGAITPVVSSSTNSPTTTGGPTPISALAVDRSGTYLFAAGYNESNGFQMFTISSSGLNVVTSQSTGNTTSVPVAIARTY